MTPQNLPRTEDDTPNYLLKEMLQAATTRAEELENEIRRINDGSMLQQEIQKNIDLTVKCSDYEKLQAKLEEAEKEVGRLTKRELRLEGWLNEAANCFGGVDLDNVAKCIKEEQSRFVRLKKELWATHEAELAQLQARNLELESENKKLRVQWDGTTAILKTGTMTKEDFLDYQALKARVEAYERVLEFYANFDEGRYAQEVLRTHKGESR